MRKHNEIFSSLHTVYRLTTTVTELQHFAVGICRLYRNVLKADKVVIICRTTNSKGFLKVRLEKKTQSVKEGGLSILTRVEKEILKQEKEITLNNRMIYPFVFFKILGAIYIKRVTKSPPFDELEKKWFTALCENVSVALQIFSLYRDQQKIIVNYVKSLSKFLNQHVPTSYLHTKYIFKLIKAIEKEMNLSEAQIKSLEYASLLHDAGKIQLPSKLLIKQKPLTEEEFKLMAKHPRKGVELIKNLETLKPALPIILHHHERYDGKGYPSRLKKDEIPLGSRILAVLDTFDAMFFGRPYRKNFSLEEIENELKNQRGKQFDPKIIDIFLKILKKKNIRKFLTSFSPAK